MSDQPDEVVIPTSEEVDSDTQVSRARHAPSGARGTFRGLVRRALRLEPDVGEERTEVAAAQPRRADIQPTENRQVAPAEPAEAGYAPSPPSQVDEQKPKTDRPPDRRVRIRRPGRPAPQPSRTVRRDEPYTHRTARKRAAAKGHEVVAEFKRLRYGSERFAAPCVKCGLEMHVAEEQESGSTSYVGPASNTTCSGE